MDYILEANDIVKQFPGIKALDGVSLKIKKGEVHAVVGENGAGKSTLMLCLCGIHRLDRGQIILDGEARSFKSPHEANKKGISIVFQELSLTPNLSVAENIFSCRQPVNRFNIINRKKLNDMTLKMLSLFDANHIDPDTLVKDLSMADQQIIEILKAISFDPKVLILDEPTSSLTDSETGQLFKNIRILKEKGISFIYISHHLKEIFKIADSVTVLRDGKYICDEDVKNIDENYLVTKMVGRKLENIYGSRSKDEKIGNTVLEVKNISKKKKFSNINFKVNAGEIVGFSGLVGAGRTEVGKAIFGADSIDSGEIILNNRKIRINNPKEAIEKGIGYMSEDRKVQGLFLDFDIKTNLASNQLKRFSSRTGLINEKEITEFSKKSIDDYHITAIRAEMEVNKLSGGNQQKVLLGIWLGINPGVLIIDEPTRGVDIGAKHEIYIILREMAKKGTSIIMISSDLNEILGMSDRIIIMKAGKIAGELRKENVSEEKIISIAAGIEKTEHKG